MANKVYESIDVGRAALRMALSATREEEDRLKDAFAAEGFRTAAVNFGGEFLPSVTKIVERAMVAAERQHIVTDSHVGAGTVAGAAHEALAQVMTKASGFNVGGKIGIARYGEHVCVAVFMSVGVLNLNELAVGMGHRTLAAED
ncbi:MAG: HutP family protein [Acidaminococcus sp.]|nr:HutP family protein [Acidaminococcus sp.]MCI2100969.1 HutP family protein [Acidaminococcus sp.]MCI2115312.1 HutP family protein [Acidaminococcus sp.]MCI2117380.1 HutP family protein [Acidaminococcus sp.]